MELSLLVKISLAIALIATLGATWVSGTGQTVLSMLTTKESSFRTFQLTYLVVYLTGMIADWLQGPFVYALYDSYGYSRADNAALFVAGFGASAVFGTVVGSLADRFGRRRFAMLYCVLYIVSCLTKHVNMYFVLMLGRVTGGIATSLLFSVFDSWMVSEHTTRGFDSELLGSTFSVGMFGNSMVAILAGEIGEFAAGVKGLTHIGGNVHLFGYCAPFDVSIAFLIVCMAVMSTTWSENFGGKSDIGSLVDTSGLTDNIKSGMDVLTKKPLVLYTGIACSLFESSMFIFVFNWTPAVMEEGAPKPPFGHIFATFMVMSMLGSQLFMILTQSRPIEEVGRYTFVVAMVSHLVPVLVSDVNTRFLSFLVFEMCVGMYFPMMGTLKGAVVPEEIRSTIYNLYRLPLNVIVVLVLVLNVDMQAAFICTSTMLVGAVVCQSQIIKMHPFQSMNDSDEEAGRADKEAATELELDSLKSNEGPKPTAIGSSTGQVEAF